MTLRCLAIAILLLANTATAQGFDPSHSAFTALLKKHVVPIDGGKASRVRYADLQRDRAALESYLASLSAVGRDQFEAWSKAAQMAFLINAYNGFTLELIVQNYPVASIRDIGGIFDNRWKRKFFKLFGEDCYLDKIEHEMLRKPGVYNEPRVHYALNCASIGCPALRDEAYVADRLDQQLEEQAVRFLSDRSRNRFAGGKLQVSLLFKWFSEDWQSGYTGFDGKTPAITSREQYFARYARLLTDSVADQQLLATSKLPITYLDYDWNLNGN